MKTFLFQLHSCFHSDITCLQPLRPQNGVYTATSLSYEGSLSLQCNKGSKATSVDPVTCERSGKWSRPLPTCQSIFYGNSLLWRVIHNSGCSCLSCWLWVAKQTCQWRLQSANKSNYLPVEGDIPVHFRTPPYRSRFSRMSSKWAVEPNFSAMQT